MKKIKKIMICTIVFLMLNIIALPVLTILIQDLNINSNSVLKLLLNITDSLIANASHVDFEYSGNIYFANGKGWWADATEEEGIYIYSTSAKGRLLEYSINGGEFTKFESEGYGSSYGTSVLSLPYNVNMVKVRDMETKKICVKALVINSQDYKIAIQDGFPIASAIDGAGLYTIINRNDIEYSINNGIDFQELSSSVWTSKIDVEDLFKNKIIVRNKNTKEVIYKSPELGEIEESITYENGQTKVNFAVNGDAKDRTSYTYILNGEEFTGNSATLKEDTTLKLKAHTDKEFTDQTIEKDVNAKVIKTEKPTIKIDEENNLILTQGVIENDELANIYYSIDNETEKTYTGKVKLEVGTHKIKAYQITKNHQIKSLDETKEVIIKEPVKTEKPTIQMDKENNLILTQGKIENDELADIYYSVNDGEYKKYTGKVKFEVGIYKIKAYQVTKKYQIKSDIAEAEITVEDNKEPEIKPNEDKNPSNNNDNNKDLSNDEQNNNTNSNEENKNTETEKQKSSENKNIPKTGDMIMIYVVVLFVIITLNIVINRKRKNK